MKIICDVDNERLDSFLKTKLDNSREIIIKNIKLGNVLVNGEVVKPSYRLSADDVVDVEIEENKSNLLEARDIPFEIIYEDDHLLIINKPTGLTVHPGSGNESNTLVNGLLYKNIKLCKTDDEKRPGIIHRLDKDTSGIMLVIKTNECYEKMLDMFKQHTVKRKYIALLKGEFPHDSATVDAPIGRDDVNRVKFAVTSINSKSAVTHLKVLKRFVGYTLVSLELETGRTHQIRVHMNYIGYPVFNDPLYYNKNSTSFGQYLHSSEVCFVHPITGEEITKTCKLPLEFDEFISTLTEK